MMMALGQSLCAGKLLVPGAKPTSGTENVLPYVIVADKVFPLLPCL